MFIVLAHYNNSQRIYIIYYTPLGHTILIPRQLVFALNVSAACFTEIQFQFYCLRYDQTWPYTHDLPQSCGARESLRHRCSVRMLWKICIIYQKKTMHLITHNTRKYLISSKKSLKIPKGYSKTVS